MIRLEDIVKKYGETQVLCGVSLEIAERSVLFVVGERGAGKSTLADILCGAIAPDGGRVCSDEGARLGYMPEESPFYEDMTVYEYMSFVGEAKKVGSDRLSRNIESALELVGLEELSKRLIKKLSGAQKKLLGIAQALLGNPDVILLDEPFEGCGDEVREQMCAMLERLGTKKSVVVCCSSLELAERVSDRIMLLEAGALTEHTFTKETEEKEEDDQ